MEAQMEAQVEGPDWGAEHERLKCLMAVCTVHLPYLVLPSSLSNSLNAFPDHCNPHPHDEILLQPILKV
jgi:hypothetical protein